MSQVNLKIDLLGRRTMADIAETYINLATVETTPEAVAAALLQCAQHVIDHGLSAKVIQLPILKPASVTAAGAIRGDSEEGSKP
jgi:hypothetical protein